MAAGRGAGQRGGRDHARPVKPINTDIADIVLPAATWGEDDLTRCNSERRLRLYRKFYDAPGEARPD